MLVRRGASGSLTDRKTDQEDRKKRLKLERGDAQVGTGGTEQWKAEKRQRSTGDLHKKHNPSRHPLTSQRTCTHVLFEAKKTSEKTPEIPLKMMNLNEMGIFGAKRGLNPQKSKEMLRENQLLHKEIPISLKPQKRKSKKKPIRRKKKPSPSVFSLESKRSNSLENRLREMLKSKVELIRENEFSRPLSLGSASTVITFPADARSKFVSEQVSEVQGSRGVVGRRKLRRRKKEGENERVSTEEDFVEGVRRDLAARIIQRWFRMWRLRHRLITKLKAVKADISSEERSLHFSFESSSSLPVATKVTDRFRDLLSEEYGELNSRLLHAASQLTSCLGNSITLEDSLFTVETASPGLRRPEIWEEEPEDCRLCIPPPTVYWLPVKPETEPVTPFEVPDYRNRRNAVYPSTEAVLSPRDYVQSRGGEDNKHSLKRRMKAMDLPLQPGEGDRKYPLVSDIVIESPTKLPSDQANPTITGAEIDELVDLWIQREVNYTVNTGKKQPVPAVDTSFEFLCYFLEQLVLQLDEKSFMDSIRTARKVDFSHINANIPELLIPKEACTRVLTSLLQDIRDSEACNQLSAYCRLLYEAGNEALDVIRPESVKGEWRPGRVGAIDLHKYANVYEAFFDVRDLMLAWSTGEVGRLGRYPEIETEPELEQIREERVSVQLLRDVPSIQVLLEDKAWVDYDQETLSCQVDLTNQVLTALVQETVDLLSRHCH